MPRIPLISPESDLSPVQRRVVDGILGKRGGRIPGPYRFGLHCPEMTEVWHPLGEMLRLKSNFSPRLSEFAIVITARAWDCGYVFNAHADAAVKGGIAQSVIDAMVKGERPALTQDDEKAMYDYCTELFEHHAVSDQSHARARELFGIPGVVELTALIGYYSMVAMTILAHEMPLQEGARPLLPKRP
ncbi:MAG: carboxymuconolactone decarboxylase family protein [Betaproteobacteria bacterium]|nr:carboxymuconolactone decarboxylase family protein [Betaproteobacteria bacterium]MBI3055303.1 carboxymuconolactone decarboxylase family protein [Betaproteobacteria bacterium]